MRRPSELLAMDVQWEVGELLISDGSIIKS